MPVSSTNLQRLVEVVRTFNIAMLTTVDKKGRFHARPMHIADVADDGTLTFIISIDNELVAELTDNNRAGVTLQGARTFVTLSGILCLDANGTRFDEYWSGRWRQQFPTGPHDPELRLLELRPDVGAYWTDHADGPIDELVAAGRSMIFGESAAMAGTGEHAVIEFNEP